MRTLLAYEFKKLFGRKATWVALIFCLAAFVAMNWGDISHYCVTGYTQGMRDVYRLYEGQTVTAAFRAQAQKEYDGYIAAHAERYEAIPADPEAPAEVPVYFAKGPGYYEGAWFAYQDIVNLQTIEDKQKGLQEEAAILASGISPIGRPLSDADRRFYEARQHDGVQANVVHYAEFWNRSVSNENLSPGILTLLFIALFLLGLFNGEASARLDAVVLCAKARRQVVWAKLWAAVILAGGAAIVFFGLQFALSAFTWGLDGAGLPFSAIYFGLKADGLHDIPIGTAYAISRIFLVLAAMCCGLTVAWASARWRPLGALLASGIVLGGMLAAQNTYSSYSVMLRAGIEGNTALQAYSLIDTVWSQTDTLPANVLMMDYTLPYRVARTAMLIPELVAPLGLAVLFCWLAHRAFLRRRRT